MHHSISVFAILALPLLASAAPLSRRQVDAVNGTPVSFTEIEADGSEFDDQLVIGGPEDDSACFGHSALKGTSLKSMTLPEGVTCSLSQGGDNCALEIPPDARELTAGTTAFEANEITGSWELDCLTDDPAVNAKAAAVKEIVNQSQIQRRQNAGFIEFTYTATDGESFDDKLVLGDLEEPQNCMGDLGEPGTGALLTSITIPEGATCSLSTGGDICALEIPADAITLEAGTTAIDPAETPFKSFEIDCILDDAAANARSDAAKIAFNNNLS